MKYSQTITVLRKKALSFISHVKITIKYQVMEIVVIDLKEWHKFKNKDQVDFSKNIAYKGPILYFRAYKTRLCFS